MWELRPDDPTRGQAVLFPVPDHVGAYSVGRKDNDMLVTNDKSISRNHAQITHKPEGLTLMDTGSKFGTQVNGTKLAQNEPYTLTEGDKVILGTTHFTVARRQLASDEEPAASPVVATQQQEVQLTVHHTVHRIVHHMVHHIVHHIVHRMVHRMAHHASCRGCRWAASWHRARWSPHSSS